jgi:FkbM family methyltransferase
MRISMARAVANTARRFGYTFAPTWSAHHISLAMHLQAIFSVLRIDCVLDVGANVGQYRKFLRDRVGYQGLIISFEPLPALIKALKEEAAKDSNWVVLEYALGSENRIETFHEMSDTQFSSFLSPDESVVKSFSNQNKLANSINVEIKTLDSLYSMLSRDYQFSRPYLKMDTQGYDLEVIDGARATLPVIPALQTEASVIPIYKDMPDFRTVIGRLEDEGYRLSTVAPTNPVGGLYLVEFDCVMVRREADRSAT